MALSKVNGPHPAPGSRSLCLLKTGHRGTSGLYDNEQQVHWGQEWGPVMSQPHGQHHWRGYLEPWYERPWGLGMHLQTRASVPALTGRAGPPVTSAHSPHGGARGLLPVPGRHLQSHTSEPWEARAIPPAWDPFSQDHRVRGLGVR